MPASFGDPTLAMRPATSPPLPRPSSPRRAQLLVKLAQAHLFEEAEHHFNEIVELLSSRQAKLSTSKPSEREEVRARLSLFLFACRGRASVDPGRTPGRCSTHS